MPAVGTMAPDFTLPSQEGTPISLHSLNGKPLCTTDVDHVHVAAIEAADVVAIAASKESSDAALKLARFASTVL
jgi:peroxiredoxin